MVRLLKGSEIHISHDYEWKYGEPSIYSDEQQYYLVFRVNGDIVDNPDDEDRILKLIKRDYKELLRSIKQTGDLELIL